MGVVEVNTENSRGFCVPDNSSANELILSISRAGAIAQSAGGAGNHVVAVSAPHCCQANCTCTLTDIDHKSSH